MPKRLLIFNLLLACLALLFLAGLAREVVSFRARPARPPARPAQPAATVPSGPPSGETRAAPQPDYSVIAQRNPFNPVRREFAAAKAAPASKPFLHGVVLNGEQSRAYLEDPAAKRVFGYTVGDAVAGGRLESIAADRVVIARPEGAIEVLLQDPSRPKPSAPTAVAGPPGSSSPAPALGAPTTPVQPRRRPGPGQAAEPPQGSEPR